MPEGVTEVICLGILVADVIGRPIESVPARGALALVESITPHIGGCAANTGIALQKLGVQTRVVGKFGRDEAVTMHQVWEAALQSQREKRAVEVN